MADAAARREARRRRILDNSENRLQRITGSKSSSVQEDEPNNIYNTKNPQSTDPATEILPKINLFPNPTQPKTTEIFDQIHSENEEFLIQSLSYELNKRNLAREGSISLDDELELTDHNLRNERFLQDERQTSSFTNKANNQLEKEVNPHDTIGNIVLPAETSLLYSVLASKWTLVILAALVNVLYILQLENFYGKTILAPFFGLMVVRLHLDNKIGNRGGTMLSAALILCNIKPELVHNLSSVLRISKKIAEEFSIYVFSFVIVYNASYLYHNDIADATTSAIDSANNEQLR